jgi:hypothetical protein
MPAPNMLTTKESVDRLTLESFWLELRGIG